MLLQYPLQYEIVGTTNRARNPVRRNFEEIIEVEIPEVNGNDAPVAVQWRPGHYPASRMTLREGKVSGPDGLQLTRWYEGSHWKRLCDGHFFGEYKGGELATGSYLQAMMEHPQKKRLIANATGFRYPLSELGERRMKRVDRDPRQAFETIRIDGRQNQLDTVKEALPNLIAVDGIVYSRCLEPFVFIEIRQGSNGPECVDISLEVSNNIVWFNRPDRGAYFSVREWDAAARFAYEHGFRPEGGIAIDPEILIEESLIDDWNLYHQTAAEIDALRESLWMDLRELVPLLSKARDCQNLDEQYEMMLSFDPDDVRWADNHSARMSYEKIMDILAARPISLPLSSERPRVV